MAIAWAPRLVALLLLLLFQIISIASDIVFFKTKENFPPTYIDDPILERTFALFSGGSLTSKVKDFFKNIDISRVVVPLLFTTLSAVIISVLFSGAGNTYRDTGNACSTKPDTDISGVGVRASIWGQIGMLILISGCGHFHKKETAIKEVAGGLILTHVSLAIAIIVQMYKKTLTSVDAAIGAAILDAQNVALHIPVTAKQTLAARWQVLILIPTQILGLAFLPVLVVKFNRGSFASEDCKCFNIFWWSYFSDCEAFPGSGLSLFWIYYSLRWIMWVQASVHSVYNAEWFHRSEKEGRIPVYFTKNGLEDDSKKARALERYHFPKRRLEKATIQTGLLYKEYSATTSVSHTTYALYSVTSMSVAEVIIRKYSLQPVSQVNSIGQIIAMVVALATFIRVVWSFQNLYNRFENNSFPDLVFNPRKSWLTWCCCVDPKEDGTGDGQASISPKQDGEDPLIRSDTDSENNGSGGRRSSQHAAPLTPPKCEACGQAEQYVQQYPQSPASRNGRPSFDGTDMSKTQPYSPLEKDSRTRHTLPGRPKTPPQRSYSYEPGYRFEFQQPFHLDAIKQLFLPTFTQHLEIRKKKKVRRGMMASSLTNPPTIDQAMACKPPQQSQRVTDRGKAPLLRSVEKASHQAETSTSRDNQHPVITSGKPPDSMGAKTIPEIDNPVVMDQSGKGPELEDSQSQLATSRDMTPGSILAHPGPKEDKSTVARKLGERQRTSLRYPTQIPEEQLLESSKAREAARSSEPEIIPQGHDECKGAQSDLQQGIVSVHTEENSPAPVSIFGDGQNLPANRFASTPGPTNVSLESRMEYPGIVEQSKGGKGPQEAQPQSEKGRASVRSMDQIDIESDTGDQKTKDHSTTALDSGGLTLESVHLSPIGIEEDLPEQSRRDQLARQWDRDPSNLRVNPPRELSPDDLKRDRPSLWNVKLQKRLKEWEESGEPDPRSGCSGNMGKCEQSETVWEDYSSFLRHCLTHLGQKGQFETGTCHECAKSSTSSNPAPRFVRLTELARHIWDEHLHKDERDALSPSLPEAEQGKGKSAETWKPGRSHRIDNVIVDPGTVIDRSVL